MRAEEFCFRRSQKVSVPTVNSISNDKLGFENFTVTDFDSLRTLPVGGLPPFLLSCSCTFVIRYTVYSWYTHFLRPLGAKFLRPHGGARRFGVPKT